VIIISLNEIFGRLQQVEIMFTSGLCKHGPLECDLAA
jgi:hypothetical protein